jgi:hypothetical protein
MKVFVPQNPLPLCHLLTTDVLIFHLPPARSAEIAPHYPSHTGRREGLTSSTRDACWSARLGTPSSRNWRWPKWLPTQLSCTRKRRHSSRDQRLLHQPPPHGFVRPWLHSFRTCVISPYRGTHAPIGKLGGPRRCCCARRSSSTASAPPPLKLVERRCVPSAARRQASWSKRGLLSSSSRPDSPRRGAAGVAPAAMRSLADLVQALLCKPLLLSELRGVLGQAPIHIVVAHATCNLLATLSCLWLADSPSCY